MADDKKEEKLYFEAHIDEEEYRRNEESDRASKKQRQQAERKDDENSEDKQTNMPFNFKILTQPHKSKLLWIILLIIAAPFLYFWFQKGLDSTVNFIWNYVSLIFGAAVILILVLYGLFNDSDDKMPGLFIFFAYAIWIFDLLPFFGGAYSGYKFDPLILIETNWVAVFTSGVVSAFLIYKSFDNVFRKDDSFVISFIMLAIINSTASSYLNISSISNPVLNIIFLALVLGVAAFILHKQGWKFHSEIFSYSVMVLVFSFYWINWSWTANFKAILHVGFIIVFCLTYLSKVKSISKNKLYFFTAAFLIVDFFGYSMKISSYDLSFPLIVIVTSWYCYFTSKNTYAFVNALVLAIVFVGLNLAPQPAFGATGVQLQKNEATGFKGLFSAFSNFASDINKKVQGNLESATGGLYNGNVEKNQYESLGVFFSDIRASEPKFYTDEQVTLWGTIRSKTYQDMVVVNYKCYRWNNDQQDFSSARYNPKGAFPVFKLEETDVDCSFPSGSFLQPGVNTVTFSADYNFATNAYLKSYFIDKDRYRALVRENLDPFNEFGIKDKSPQPTFTNGPVQIGIGVEPLIKVSDTYTVLPTIGVSLLNRKQIEDKDKKIISTWDGKIGKITELVILTPPGVTIPKIEECSKENFDKGNCPCNRPFKKYEGTDCRSACTKQVNEPCTAVCKDGASCGAAECQIIYDNCNKECDSLFSVSNGEGPVNSVYNGYALDVDSIQYRDEYKDIDKQKYRTFVCRIQAEKSNPNGPSALDNTPITTRYFRVRARYNYALQKSVTINVERPPTAPKTNNPPVLGFNSKIPDNQYLGVYFNKDNANEVKYSQIVLDKSKQYDIEYLFVKSIIQTENSPWNPEAKGDSGKSSGLMQVSADTASKLGCDKNYQTDPALNIDCGVKLIRQLINVQSSKNLKPGLGNIAGGYNCGEGAMYYSKSDNTMAIWEVPPNCQNSANGADTQNYVSKVMINYETLNANIPK